jgi:ABC-type sugar transport system permease subunit
MFPNLTLFTLFVVVPAAAGIALSFYRWDLFTAPVAVGLKNYQNLFQDPLTWLALSNTVKALAMTVVPTLLLAFGIAAGMNVQHRGVGVLRVIFLAPMLVSTAVAGTLWAWLYNPRFGIINSFLGLFHITGPSWLSDPAWALPAIAIMLIWLTVPFAMILYLVAIQRIPREVLESATLDGAGAWTRMWRIIWPNVTPTTILLLIYLTLNGLTGPFELAVIMTHGGPLQSTTTLGYDSYLAAFADGRVGYASAISVFQVAVVLVLLAAISGLRVAVTRTRR